MRGRCSRSCSPSFLELRKTSGQPLTGQLLYPRQERQMADTLCSKFRMLGDSMDEAEHGVRAVVVEQPHEWPAPNTP